MDNTDFDLSWRKQMTRVYVKRALEESCGAAIASLHAALQRPENSFGSWDSLFGLAIGIGGTIGAGILRTPGDLATYLPSAVWIMGLWVAGGIYCFICSDIFAELGTAIPRSGGLYTFAQRGLGNYAGFLLGYTDAASICAANAALGIVVGEYLGVLVPAVAGHEVLIAAVVILTLGALNWSGGALGIHHPAGHDPDQDAGASSP